ncbi:hypothetical protein PG995_002199 [Apiospora arundinis]|uniref:Uncharacterized protein n=1 Tax=Apiospora arundinis TaxID=335852 RepID=A0ABR2J6M1_9PEZI
MVDTGKRHWTSQVKSRVPVPNTGLFGSQGSPSLVSYTLRQTYPSRSGPCYPHLHLKSLRAQQVEINNNSAVNGPSGAMVWDDVPALGLLPQIIKALG